MKKESEAIRKLCHFKSKVSSNFFIQNNGKIICLVPELFEAWHAGKSSWGKYKSLNRYSIGIEINNPGHEHGYKKFSQKQILSLIKLLRYLIKKYNIKKQNILGHSDIAPNRKKDPGEKFPWKKLAKKNLCRWHSFNEYEIKKYRNLRLSKNQEEKFLKNLFKIGYARISESKYQNNKKKLIKSFQRKFRQNLINGITDQECLIISQDLLKF